MNENTDEAGIRILTEEELVSAVLEKHRRFLETDRKEFEELDTRLSQVEKEVQDSKSSRIRIAERKEVLKEKRQQFYHQAEALLEKELFPKLDQITVDKFKEDVKKLKSQIEPEEEENLKKGFIENLRETSLAKSLDESLVLHTQARMEEARSANLELKGLIESEKQLEVDDGSKGEEISKSKSQHKWLSTKIKNHEEALNYWEKLKT